MLGRCDDAQRVSWPLELESSAPQGRGLLWLFLAGGLMGGVVIAWCLPAARPLGLSGGLLCALALAVRPVLDRLRDGRFSPDTAYPRASIAVDALGVWRVGANGEAAPIARWDEAFGVITLVNPYRTKAVLAFTCAERTRLIAVRIESGPQGAWLDDAVTVTDADLDDALLGLRHGSLSGKSADALVAAVARRNQTALGRLELVDASGGKITLEGSRLEARGKVVDLGEPVEWRSFTFHDGGAGVVVYQATWVRQGTIELVLVCPLPPDASSLGLGRSSNHPPEREQSVAVDRLFMAPLRRALEGAPRISRAGAPPLGHPGLKSGAAESNG
jgi:hypothetical protein